MPAKINSYSLHFCECKHESQTETLLENCLCAGRRQILSFLSSASHQQACDGLPAKKRQQTHVPAHSPRVRHHIKRTLRMHRFVEGQPPSLHEHKTKRWHAHFLWHAAFLSHYAAETGLGAAWFRAEVKSTAHS